MCVCVVPVIAIRAEAPQRTALIQCRSLQRLQSESAAAASSLTLRAFTPEFAHSFQQASPPTAAPSSNAVSSLFPSSPFHFASQS